MNLKTTYGVYIGNGQGMHYLYNLEIKIHWSCPTFFHTHTIVMAGALMEIAASGGALGESTRAKLRNRFLLKGDMYFQSDKMSITQQKFV
jgi:hypothetical protein